MNNIWRSRQSTVLLADNLLKAGTKVMVNDFFTITSSVLTVIKGRHINTTDTISLITNNKITVINDISKFSPRIISDNFVKKLNSGLSIPIYQSLTVIKGYHINTIDSLSIITQLPVNTIINDIWKFDNKQVNQRLRIDNLTGNLLNKSNLFKIDYQILSVGINRMRFNSTLNNLIQNYVLNTEDLFFQEQIDEPNIILDASIKLSLHGNLFSGTYNNPKKFTATRVNPVKINALPAPIFPPTNNLLLYLKFDTIQNEGNTYFKDYSGNGLDCLAVTTTTLNDSIQLNNDIRLQNAALNANCWPQFYGAFQTLNQTTRTWINMDINTTTGDIYAVCYPGDIYKQTGGVGDFIAMGFTSRNYVGIAVNSITNDLYLTVQNGDIYKQTGGVGLLVALNQTVRNWYHIAINTTNNDVYAVVQNGDIYKQTGGVGDFIALNQTVRSYYGVTINSVNGDVYVSEYGGKIYKQINSTGNFIALDQPNRQWTKLQIINNNLYVVTYGSMLYKQTNLTGDLIPVFLENYNTYGFIVTPSENIYLAIYNGSIWKYSGTVYSKTVLINNISQIYLDNQIFSNIDNNILVAYSSEVIDNDLEIILDRIGSRIKKITKWGELPTYRGSYVGARFGNKIFCWSVDYRDCAVFVFDIENKTSYTIGTLMQTSASSTGPYVNNLLITPNNHMVAYPYNETRIINFDMENETFVQYGSTAPATGLFANRYPDTTGQGRCAPDSQLLLKDGQHVLASMRTPLGDVNSPVFVKYDYINNTIDVLDSYYYWYYSGGAASLVYIKEDLVVAVPLAAQVIKNLNPITKVVETYGSLPAGNKYSSYQKIHDNLIVGIPSSGTQILLIHPLDKTIETFGNFSGTTLWNFSVVLSNGHIIGIPSGTILQFIDIDPINKTYELWGDLTSESINLKYASHIKLSNGKIILFPYYDRYVLEVDPINRTITKVYDFGDVTNHNFYMYELDASQIGHNYDIGILTNERQLLTVSRSITNIFDYDPITKKMLKVGYFPFVYGEIFARGTIIKDGEKRILLPVLQEAGIVDIELR
jgi:hypothetical protein